MGQILLNQGGPPRPITVLNQGGPPHPIDPGTGPIPTVNVSVTVGGNTDTSGQLSPSAMNSMAASPTTLQLVTAARDAPIPILYGGPEHLAGKVYIAKVVGTQLYLAVIYCQGTINQIGLTGSNDTSGIFVNDVDAGASNPGIAIHKYLGTSGQTPDSWLTAAITTPVAFNESLANTAYAVYQINAGAFTGFPRLVATIMGLSVFDPRQNLLPFSNTFSSWTQSGTCPVAQTGTGPFGATNYAWALTDSDAANLAGRTIAFTTVSSSNTYAWSVKVLQTSGGTSKTVGINVSFGGGTPVSSVVRVNTDTGATSGGTGVTAVAVGNYWLVSGTITDNATGNNSLGMILMPATANNGSFVDTVATTGTATFTEAQIRLSTIPAGYVETTTASAVNQPTAWSNNSALCLGDFLASTVYGEGRTVDATSLAAAAEYCDQMVGMSGTGTYTWSGGLVTVTSANNGIPNGATVAIAFTSGAGTPNGSYTATFVNANTFTFPLAGSGAGGNLSWGVPALNEKRSRMTFTIDTRQPVRQWRDAMRAYIPAWVVIDNGVAYIKVDQDGPVNHTFDSTSIRQDSLVTLTRSGLRDTPNAVTVSWTDTSVTPYVTGTADANTGASPRRATRIDMPGIRSYSQALRTATLRLNHYTLEDLTGTFPVFDYGLNVLEGDIAQVTDDTGLAAQKVRVLAAVDEGHGRWTVNFRTHNPAAFSNLVQAAPTQPSPLPPDPNSPPAVAGLALVQDDRLESGVWVSRIRVTWNPVSNWPFVQGFIAELFDVATNATYSQTSGVVTITSTAHGLALNDTCYMAWTSGALTINGGFPVTNVVDANHFQTVYAGTGASGNVTWRKMREHEIVTDTAWLSQPCVRGVNYSVRVRVYSISGVVGP